MSKTRTRMARKMLMQSERIPGALRPASLRVGGLIGGIYSSHAWTQRKLAIRARVKKHQDAAHVRAELRHAKAEDRPARITLRQRIAYMRFQARKARNEKYRARQVRRIGGAIV